MQPNVPTRLRTHGVTPNPLDSRQLTAADINFAIIRPLVFKYARLKNLATVYACLVVRSHFLSLAGEDLAYTGVMLARADMCEILATKLLSRFSSTKIQLASALMTSWEPLAGAPEHVSEEVRMLLSDDDEMNNPQCALEVSLLVPPKYSPRARTCAHGYVRWRSRRKLNVLWPRPSFKPS